VQNEIYRERMMVLVMLDEGDKRDYKMQRDNKKGRKGGRRAAWEQSSVLACCKCPNFVKV